MTTGTLISEEEYLNTSYEPDCEYEDGVLIERNVGQESHSRLQGDLIVYFSQHRQAWKIRVYPEYRVKCRNGKYMIPDVCVVSASVPRDPVLKVPPLLWIEILSPEDRMSRMEAKVDEILEFGVPHIWVLDPRLGKAWLYTKAGRGDAVDFLTISNPNITVKLAAVDENVEPE